nr:pyridoxal-phosphate dependent enzyme [Marinifaba aquimaris]
MQKLSTQLTQQHGINLYVKRDDLIHRDISGNKWRKISGYIPYIEQHQIKHVISFGGAFSNHIHALAHVCQQLDVQLHAYIRGEASSKNNATLSHCPKSHTHFEFLDRQTYKRRHDADFLAQIKAQFPNSLIIPEGGFGQCGLVGFKQLIEEVNKQIKCDYFFTPLGSGTTAAGLLENISPQQKVIATAAVKNGIYLIDEVKALLTDKKKMNAFELLTDYHFGGFAKVSPELLNFTLQIGQQNQLILDPIYTSKALFALFELIAANHFAAGSNIVFLHTGGLQGWQGMLERKIINQTYLDNLYNH